jgi:hypothetical protein
MREWTNGRLCGAIYVIVVFYLHQHCGHSRNKHVYARILVSQGPVPIINRLRRAGAFHLGILAR